MGRGRGPLTADPRGARSVFQNPLRVEAPDSNRPSRRVGETSSFVCSRSLSCVPASALTRYDRAGAVIARDIDCAYNNASPVAHQQRASGFTTLGRIAMRHVFQIAAPVVALLTLLAQ